MKIKSSFFVISEIITACITGLFVLGLYFYFHTDKTSFFVIECFGFILMFILTWYGIYHILHEINRRKRK